jgi:hypothetical protein
MNPSTLGERRHARLRTATESVLRSIPTFASSGEWIDEALDAHFSSPDTAAEAEKRLLDPRHRSQFEGEPEYVALLICISEPLRPLVIDAVVNHILRLRPDYEDMVIRMWAAG